MVHHEGSSKGVRPLGAKHQRKSKVALVPTCATKVMRFNMSGSPRAKELPSRKYMIKWPAKGSGGGCLGHHNCCKPQRARPRVSATKAPTATRWRHCIRGAGAEAARRDN